jgi:hypothetical protein
MLYYLYKKKRPNQSRCVRCKNVDLLLPLYVCIFLWRSYDLSDSTTFWFTLRTGISWKDDGWGWLLVWVCLFVARSLPPVFIPRIVKSKVARTVCIYQHMYRGSGVCVVHVNPIEEDRYKVASKRWDTQKCGEEVLRLMACRNEKSHKKKICERSNGSLYLWSLGVYVVIL